MQNIKEELWEVLQQDFKVDWSRSSVSLLEKILNIVSRMFWEHSPVHASFSPRTSFNAKNTYFSKWTMYKTKKHFFLGIYSQNLNKYQCQLRQGIFGMESVTFPFRQVLKFKHLLMVLIQDKDFMLSITIEDRWFIDLWECANSFATKK